MRFVAMLGINLLGAIAAIVLAGGGPLSSLQGWAGLGLLFLLAVIVSGMAWMAIAALTGDPMPLKTALPYGVGFAVAASAIVILMMGVGRTWLAPALEPFRHAGIWWPFVIIATTTMIWGVATYKGSFKLGSKSSENTSPRSRTRPRAVA